MDTVPCPKCETILKVPPTFTGKAARCPKCRGVVSIPREEDDIEEAVAVEEDEPPRRARLRQEAAPARERPRPQVEEDEDEPISTRSPAELGLVRVGLLEPLRRWRRSDAVRGRHFFEHR